MKSLEPFYWLTIYSLFRQYMFFYEWHLHRSSTGFFRGSINDEMNSIPCGKSIVACLFNVYFLWNNIERYMRVFIHIIKFVYCILCLVFYFSKVRLTIDFKNAQVASVYGFSHVAVFSVAHMLSTSGCISKIVDRCATDKCACTAHTSVV